MTGPQFHRLQDAYFFFFVRFVCLVVKCLACFSASIQAAVSPGADKLEGEQAVPNPRHYPDEIASAETGRPLRRGVKMMTIVVDGRSFTYGQPGWWASIDDPVDMEGQLMDEDNVIRAAAHREARGRPGGGLGGTGGAG